MAEPARRPNLREELVVYDELDRCPYLPGQVSRLPLRWPVHGLNPRQLDDSLASGDRRTGTFLYHTRCPNCQACEPIRLDVEKFHPNETQRRILRRAHRDLNWQIGVPKADEERVALYNRHKRERNLVVPGEDGEIDIESYSRFLVETCCSTFEFSIYLDDQLVLVAVTDRGATSLNAVYCYYDPSHPKLSLGTFAILQQVEFCREWGLKYLYLGLYVADSPHMSYKSQYLPHERMIEGKWREFGRD